MARPWNHHRCCCLLVLPRILLVLLFLLNDDSLVSVVVGYHHQPCTRALRAQFQFPDCFIPSLSTSLPFSSASFLLSHDAATGYIPPISSSTLSKTSLAWQYAKNQVGSVYQQLQDGARALDLRPKLLQNGTVIFQHGAISIPVSFQQLVSDAVAWCQENPDELVLLLPSNFAYETTTTTSSSGNDVYDTDDNTAQEEDERPAIVSAMAQVYQELGVTYLNCHDVYELTVDQVMELAALPSGGYLVALDGQDYSGTFCGKSNWVSQQIVTCWASPKNSTSNNNNPLALSTSCKTSTEPFNRLRQYTLSSANNPATDDRYTLGPPQTLYDTPLNEIQALWQVSTRSAALGMAHFSSILDDNRQSRLNERMVDMVYEERFDSISLLAVDNVALNGNALLSVLRNSCGQTNLPDTACGQQLSPPRIQPYGQVSQRVFGFCVAAFLIGFVFWFGCKLYPTLWTQLMEQWKLILRKDVSQKPKTPNNSSLNDPGNTRHPSTGLALLCSYR